jgi:hypothetical protein
MTMHMDMPDEKTNPLKVTVAVLVVFVVVWSWVFATHDHHVPSLQSDIHSLRFQLDKLESQLSEMPVADPTPHDWQGIANLVEAAKGSVEIEFDGVSIAVTPEDRR